MLSPLYGQLSPLRIPTKAARIVQDTDALAYISAVETADAQTLEDGVKFAYEDFIVGCKADGIWSAIKASCILSGARTLSGALVPLVGTAPTNFNFVTADYNRETGLKGNGSTKYLNSNRANNADPIFDKHVYFSASDGITTGSGSFLGTSRNIAGSGAGQTGVFRAGTTASMRYTLNDWSEAIVAVNPLVAHRQGLSRSPSTQSLVNRFYATNAGSTTGTYASTYNGNPVSSTNITVFRVVGLSYGDSRLSFYSIGESLNLALLDARVSTLMTALAVAIP
jgi:hypothetical protein